MRLDQFSSSKSGYSRRYKALSEINVTPLVDVMLVLLIIFMITAPLLTVGIEINLPDANAPHLDQQAEPLNVSVDRDGQIFVNEQQTNVEKLPLLLKSVSNNNPDIGIIVRADKTLNYEAVVIVLGAIVSSGFKNMTLQSQIPN
ncbi:MAG: biopolymer transporter ExbD [Pseudomonadota bacterium]